MAIFLLSPGFKGRPIGSFVLSTEGELISASAALHCGAMRTDDQITNQTCEPHWDSLHVRYAILSSSSETRGYPCLYSTILVSQSAKYLGVMLDMHVTMSAHVVNLIRTASFELRRINSVRHYLSV